MNKKESGLYPETKIAEGRVIYTSKTYRNECKNKDCKKKRQYSSSRCKDCSVGK